MIDIALNHEDELQAAYRKTWYDEKYKFYEFQYPSDIELPIEESNSRHFVSLDSTGTVIGYISYSINVVTNSVYKFGAINFTDNKFVFGKDLLTVIDDIFNKFNHRKLVYTVVCGNPVEHMYDKYTEKFGGRICANYREEVKLWDGKIYDVKIYELFNDEYNQRRKQ